MPVHLKYFQKICNAGDQFSLALAKQCFSPEVVSCDDQALDVPNVILIGSILNWADEMSYICGAGLISQNTKVAFKPKKINCVRGPLTAINLEKQGIQAPALFGDPGILAPKVFPASQPISSSLGIIPHYVDRSNTWLENCRSMGIPIIDVFLPLDQYFAELQRCEIILSSSLHGLIFAHAYGKPALWIELSDKVVGDGYKFFDYYQSMAIPAEKVKRVKVTANTDPLEIGRMAQEGAHSDLLSSLEEAIAKTRIEMSEG